MNILHRRSILGSVFILALAAEGTGGGGGSSAPKSVEEQLSALRTDLTAAQSQVTALTGERDTARNELASARAEVERLTSQFDSLTVAANQLRTDLTAAQSQVTTLTGERDTARNELAVSAANNSRLETLCSVKGVDPKSAVPTGSAPQGKKSASEWEQRIAAAKTPAEINSITKEFEAAVAAGLVA